jgi:hypothetical protein
MPGIKGVVKTAGKPGRRAGSRTSIVERNLAAPGKDFYYLGDLFRRATSIITGAECTAWGLLGAVSGYCLAYKWSLAITMASVGLPLGFIVGVAIYTLVNPPGGVLVKCLERAKLNFASKRITKKQFEILQERCLSLHQ